MQTLTRGKYNQSPNTGQGANSLDKLAQLDTDQSKRNKRAKKKAYAMATVLPLMTFANQGGSTLNYHRTYTCSMVLNQVGDNITSTQRCRQRWCPVCSSIRTAKLIRQYEKPIRAMKNPIFITLTRQSVYADELEPTFQDMKRAFVNVKRNMQKTYGIKLIAMRKTESQYKYVGNSEYTYNPHFHIVADLLPCQALLLKTMWLNQFSQDIASPDAQDMRKADEDTLLELFKYEVKPITTNKEGKFSPEALNVIYESLYKQKCIQAYGMKADRLTEEQEQEIETLPASEPKTDVWTFKGLNYFNADGESLTNFVPSEKDMQFFAITGYNPKYKTIHNASEKTIQPSQDNGSIIQDYIRRTEEITGILQKDWTNFV
jgi:hypothetical protein